MQFEAAPEAQPDAPAVSTRPQSPVPAPAPQLSTKSKH